MKMKTKTLTYHYKLVTCFNTLQQHVAQQIAAQLLTFLNKLIRIRTDNIWRMDGLWCSWMTMWLYCTISMLLRRSSVDHGHYKNSALDGSPTKNIALQLTNQTAVFWFFNSYTLNLHKQLQINSINLQYECSDVTHYNSNTQRYQLYLGITTMRSAFILLHLISYCHVDPDIFGERACSTCWAQL